MPQRCTLYLIEGPRCIAPGVLRACPAVRPGSSQGFRHRSVRPASRMGTARGASPAARRSPAARKPERASVVVGRGVFVERPEWLRHGEAGRTFAAECHVECCPVDPLMWRSRPCLLGKGLDAADGLQGLEGSGRFTRSHRRPLCRGARLHHLVVPDAAARCRTDRARTAHPLSPVRAAAAGRPRGAAEELTGERRVPCGCPAQGRARPGWAWRSLRGRGGDRGAHRREQRSREAEKQSA